MKRHMCEQEMNYLPSKVDDSETGYTLCLPFYNYCIDLSQNPSKFTHYDNPI